MTEPKDEARKPTRSLNQRHTAWYQLASAAGSLLDRFQGEVSDTNRDDLWTLRECVNRVMEIEGMIQRPKDQDQDRDQVYDVEINGDGRGRVP